jgi:hypothetical protein
MAEDVQERYLEIREVGSGMVVTVVEVRSGEGKQKYDAKRQKILSSDVNLVEVDLLRTGDPKPVTGGIQSDYRILVSRADRRPAADLYAFNLRDVIPLFPLPL